MVSPFSPQSDATACPSLPACSLRLYEDGAIWHLLTHAAGLSSDLGADPVAEAYRQKMGEAAKDGPLDLARRVDVWGAQPLLFEPRTRWRYSNAADVLGQLVEVLSGSTGLHSAIVGA